MKVCRNIYYFYFTYFITLFTLHVYPNKHTALKSVWKDLYCFYLLFHCPWGVCNYFAEHKAIATKFNEMIIFSMILLSATLFGSLKMQACIQSVLFSLKFGRSFKSSADTSLGIQVTNVFRLIHVYCLQAMCIFLVNETSVSFWGNVWVMFYWNMKS